MTLEEQIDFCREKAITEAIVARHNEKMNNTYHCLMRSLLELQQRRQQDAKRDAVIEAAQLTPERIEWAIKQTEYKYFGNYEFTDGQFEAVEILVQAAKSALAALEESEK